VTKCRISHFLIGTELGALGQGVVISILCNIYMSLHKHNHIYRPNRVCYVLNDVFLQQTNLAY
jgi:hypothetical protein